MIRLAAILLLLAGLVAFLFGWSSNPAKNVNSAPIGAARLTVPIVQAPGIGIVSASDYLLGLNPPPPPPPPPPKPVPPPPPPPPDISILFRKQISAIVPAIGGRTSGSWQAELVDGTGGMRHVRTIRLGDEFQDGWKLVGLTRQDALLRKRNDQRHIVFFGPPTALPAIAPAKPQTSAKGIKPVGGNPMLAQPPKVGPALTPSSKP